MRFQSPPPDDCPADSVYAESRASSMIVVPWLLLTGDGQLSRRVNDWNRDCSTIRRIPIHVGLSFHAKNTGYCLTVGTVGCSGCPRRRSDIALVLRPAFRSSRIERKATWRYVPVDLQSHSTSATGPLRDPGYRRRRRIPNPGPPGPPHHLPHQVRFS